MNNRIVKNLESNGYLHICEIQLDFNALYLLDPKSGQSSAFKNKKIRQWLEQNIDPLEYKIEIDNSLEIDSKALSMYHNLYIGFKSEKDLMFFNLSCDYE